MKGIMIIGFNKSPGAYIDTQHPSGISERLNVKTSDLMNIYALHRMRNMEPNFIQMKIKKVSVASFYTGFSFKHFVGKPDFAITVFLSDDENPDKDFEGMLRRIANDLLPERNSLGFDQDFISYYERLKSGDIEPYWEEFIEGEGSKIATIHADEEPPEKIYKENSEESQQEEVLEDLNFDDQFDNFEKEELREEIKDLQELVNQKNLKIRELTDKITEKISEKSEHTEEVKVLKEQLEEKNEKIDEWSNKLVDLNEKNTILQETVRKLTEMSAQQTEEMEQQAQTIGKLRKELDKKEKKISDQKATLDELNNKLMNAKVSAAENKEKDEEIQKLHEEIGELKKNLDTLQEKYDELQIEKENLQERCNDLEEDNELHLETIAHLKLDLKEAKEQASSEDGVYDDLADQIIDLKKDIKVLRRERDHYKEIVKEHDLL
ncbi:MAG: hypothetical protein ACOC44_03005 [Promethearchaeia archaeon]